MPKFVPVVDNEKSLLEQREDSEFDKHRRFDNPHKVDRGWQQGNVGWGVLGAFGSNNKDDAAQVIKRAEGSNKMIKNDRGLWVKAKELEDGASIGKPAGRGRGGGISVYGELTRSVDISSDFDSSRKSSSGQYDDADYQHPRERKNMPKAAFNKNDDRRHEETDRDRYDYKNKEENRVREDSNRRRSRSRSPDRRRTDDRYSRRSPEDRRRDRSPRRSNSRDRRRRDDRPTKHRDSKHSRSRSRDRERRRDPDRDRDRDDNRSRDDRKHRKDDRNYESSTRTKAETDRIDNATENDAKTSVVLEMDEDAALQAEMMRSITAVQVINRFHEVFRQDKLFGSERLRNIGQVFAPDAVIASLKSGVEHIKGQRAVEDSFAKTSASEPVISKRIYIESATPSVSSVPAEEGEETAAESAVPSSKVTFCLDFHRPGTAPGLGDRAKHTVLLYRCENAKITHIWGMVDHEQLSQPEELTKPKIIQSKVWALVQPLLVKDLCTFNETTDAHFHNYDRMEVWGLF